MDFAEVMHGNVMSSERRGGTDEKLRPVAAAVRHVGEMKTLDQIRACWFAKKQYRPGVHLIIVVTLAIVHSLDRILHRHLAAVDGKARARNHFTIATEHLDDLLD